MNKMATSIFRIGGLSHHVISHQQLIQRQNTRHFYKKASAYLKKRKQPKVAVLNLCGTIQANMNKQTIGGSKKLNLESLYKPINKAFDMKGLKEVCLVVNSPGGSAVQSELIANRIMHLSKVKNVDVVSFVEDYAASGGYWLACAGKEIYTAENSVAGSIGVLSFTFGLDNFVKRYDIEPRVITKGKHKMFMNPFLPVVPEQKEIMDRVLQRVYVNFTNFVKQQRGSRLKAEDDVLFTGEVWVGEDAVNLGLVDGVKTLSDYLYEKYGGNVNVVRINSNRGGIREMLSSGVTPPSVTDINDLLFYEKYKFL